MAPIVEKLVHLFKGKAKVIPENQDALEAYPLRMQISAIPERRYLRTARLLTVLSFFNMAIMMILAGLFTYDVVRLDVSIANRKVVNLYAMDPENKVLQAAEYDETSVSALALMLEKKFKEYIIAYFTINLDPQKQQEYWGGKSIIEHYTNPKLLKTFKEKNAPYRMSQARSRGINQEVHVYSVRESPGGTWEALIDIFDMKPRDPFHPLCDCDDNSKTCLKCKEEHNLGRKRYRVYLRGAASQRPANIYNPLGISIDGLYVTPQPIHPGETFWNLPPVLRPDLEQL